MKTPIKVADIGSYTRQEMKVLALKMLGRQPVGRRVTFECGGEILTKRIEDVYDCAVTFDNVPFDITGVRDTWTPEKGLVREITADEYLPDSRHTHD